VRRPRLEPHRYPHQRTNGLTGVYLGGKFVLTANHVGAGDIDLGGTIYTCVPGTAVQLDNGDGTYADLLM